MVPFRKFWKLWGVGTSWMEWVTRGGLLHVLQGPTSCRLSHFLVHWFEQQHLRLLQRESEKAEGRACPFRGVYWQKNGKDVVLDLTHMDGWDICPLPRRQEQMPIPAVQWIREIPHRKKPSATFIGEEMTPEPAREAGKGSLCTGSWLSAFSISNLLINNLTVLPCILLQPLTFYACVSSQVNVN